MRQIQSKFGLSDVYLFKAERFFAVGVDALQKERVLKILGFCESANAAFFEKHGKAFVQIGPTVDEWMSERTPAPVFVNRIGSERQDRWVSRSHLAFFEQCGIVFPDYARKVGDPVYSLSHALVES